MRALLDMFGAVSSQYDMKIIQFGTVNIND